MPLGPRSTRHSAPDLQTEIIENHLGAKMHRYTLDLHQTTAALLIHAYRTSLHYTPEVRVAHHSLRQRWAGPRMAGRGQKQVGRSRRSLPQDRPGDARLGLQRYFEFTSRRKLPISNVPKDFRYGPVVSVGIATYEWRATLQQCGRTTYKENLSVSFPPHLRSNPDVANHSGAW